MRSALSSDAAACSHLALKKLSGRSESGTFLPGRPLSVCDVHSAAACRQRAFSCRARAASSRRCRRTLSSGLASVLTSHESCPALLLKGPAVAPFSAKPLETAPRSRSDGRCGWRMRSTFACRRSRCRTRAVTPTNAFKRRTHAHQFPSNAKLRLRQTEQKRGSKTAETQTPKKRVLAGPLVLPAEEVERRGANAALRESQGKSLRFSLLPAARHPALGVGNSKLFPKHRRRDSGKHPPLARRAVCTCPLPQPKGWRKELVANREWPSSAQRSRTRGAGEALLRKGQRQGALRPSPLSVKASLSPLLQPPVGATPRRRSSTNPQPPPSPETRMQAQNHACINAMPPSPSGGRLSQRSSHAACGPRGRAASSLRATGSSARLQRAEGKDRPPATAAPRDSTKRRCVDRHTLASAVAVAARMRYFLRGVSKVAHTV